MVTKVVDHLKLENIVSPQYISLSLTGSFCDHPFQQPHEEIRFKSSGWEWDKRKVEDHTVDSTRYTWKLGGHRYGLRDGTKRHHWQSGAISGLGLTGLSSKKYPDETSSWTPLVEPGLYSTLFKERTLFSDFSVAETLSEHLFDSKVSSHELHPSCLLDSLTITLYKRGKDFVNWPFQKYLYTNLFSGKIQEDLAEMQVDENPDSSKSIPDSAIWDNLSDRLCEFIVDSRTYGKKVVYLNRDASVKVGDFSAEEIPSCQELEAGCQFFGNGNQTGRDCFSEFFPLAKNSVRIFICNNGLVEEWKEVETLNFSTENEKHFSVDHDLGIITLGGYKAPDLHLQREIGPEDSRIACFIDDEAFSSYPASGIITINSEKILYYGKGRNSFLGCVRGYNNTVAQKHPHGSKVSDTRKGRGVPSRAKIYGSYTAVPRAEYEILPHGVRTANRAPFLDLKAIKNAVTNNILQISPTELHVASITLDIDAAVISRGNLWGPQYYGSDYSRLTATVSNSHGDPVEGVDATIVLTTNSGTLNGSFREYTALSNSAGEIYSYFNAPYDWDSIKKDVTRIIHENGNTTLVIPKIPSGVLPEEVTVYQSLKIDKTLGTVGEKMRVLEVSNSLESYTLFGSSALLAKANIIVESVYPDPASQWKSAQTTDMQSPFHHLTGPDASDRCPGSANSNYGNAIASVLFKNNQTDEYLWVHRKIWDAFTVYEDAAAVGTCFVFGSLIPEAILENCSVVACWAIERDAEIWNTSFAEGLDVLLYEWNSEVVHPISGSLGAYAPVKPDSVTPESLEFAGKLLPMPAPNSDFEEIDNILGGYNVVCPSMVEFYAKCKDPVSGKILRSNKIRLKLTLPPYLDGVDKTGVLPIPYGMGFIKEEHNVASDLNIKQVGTGIGGANFLTINPSTDIVSSFSLQLDQLEE